MICELLSMTTSQDNELYFKQLISVEIMSEIEFSM